MKELAFDVIGMTGIGLVSVGAGLNWGLGTGLMVCGGLMLGMLALVTTRAARG